MPLDSYLSRAKTNRTDATIKRVDFGIMPRLFDAHRGQKEAWELPRDLYHIVAVCAGWQSGKSSIGTAWLLREIQETPGCEDYAAAAPNFPLMNKKLLPELKKGLKGIAKYRPGTRVFESTAEGLKRMGRTQHFTIHLLHCEDPDAFEAGTYGALWIDEPGQVADVYYRAAQARLAVKRGKMLLTSRPYRFNWYKREIWDNRWDELTNPGSMIRVVNFRSCDNPEFPMETYLERKKELPEWLFSMLYDGVFTRPAGAVYDCFDPAVHCRFPLKTIPDEVEVVIGLDFGLVHMSAVWAFRWLNERGDKCWHIIGSYLAGQRSPEEHVTQILQQIKQGMSAMKVRWRIVRAVGGSWSEDNWRAQFAGAGLEIERPPYRLVEPGIQCLYRELKAGRITMGPKMSKLRQEFEDYAFEVTDDGDVIDAIKDKARYHRLDASRYIFSAESPLTPNEERAANLTRRGSEERSNE